MISEWLPTVARAAKALRVYERNNEMITQFMDRTYSVLAAIHNQLPELTLTVREDRLMHGHDAVYVNPDRQEGIPFLLYRNAFRRLTFASGMTREELLEFLAALGIDFGSFAHQGEDLLTVLWRLQLPHLRYFTIDALSMTTADATTEIGKKQVVEGERIQGQIDSLVAKLYSSKEVSDEDLVRGVSITREDLEALRTIRAESDEDLDLLDVPTARVIAAVDEDERRGFRALLEHEPHERLTARVIETLTEVLCRQGFSQDSAKMLEMIEQLFDTLLLARRFAGASQVVQALHQWEAARHDPKASQMSRGLLRLLSATSRVSLALSPITETGETNLLPDVVGLLRSLGPDVCGSLLGNLESLSTHAHRRAICELIAELGLPDATLIHDQMRASSWAVVVDLLELSSHLPLGDRGPLIQWAVEHEHPKVRAQALHLLNGFPQGKADELIAKALRDPAAEVRAVSLGLARRRRTPIFREILDALLTADDLHQREERELGTLVTTFGLVGGELAVARLDELLSPGVFTRNKSHTAQIAAAIALGKIGTELARKALVKGSRTLNGKVREACRRALLRADPEEGDPDGETTVVGAQAGPSAGAAPSAIDLDDSLSLTDVHRPASRSGAVLLPASAPPKRAPSDRGDARSTHKTDEIRVIRGQPDQVSTPPSPPSEAAPPPASALPSAPPWGSKTSPTPWGNKTGPTTPWGSTTSPTPWGSVPSPSQSGTQPAPAIPSLPASATPVPGWPSAPPNLPLPPPAAVTPAAGAEWPPPTEPPPWAGDTSWLTQVSGPPPWVPVVPDAAATNPSIPMSPASVPHLPSETPTPPGLASPLRPPMPAAATREPSFPRPSSSSALPRAPSQTSPPVESSSSLDSMVIRPLEPRPAPSAEPRRVPPPVPPPKPRPPGSKGGGRKP